MEVLLNIAFILQLIVQKLLFVFFYTDKEYNSKFKKYKEYLVYLSFLMLYNCF